MEGKAASTVCLAVPGRIVSIDGLSARADFRGVSIDLRLDLLPDARVGEWILAHAGFAIQRMAEEEAENALETLDAVFGRVDETTAPGGAV
jgi:hydrogenase expression/formation protein HypC